MLAAIRTVYERQNCHTGYLVELIDIFIRFIPYTPVTVAARSKT
jgi:hypothetical protein